VVGGVADGVEPAVAELGGQQAEQPSGELDR
jgi:hypothetical protein